MDIPSPEDRDASHPTIIKAEVNVLRAPFFALQNKNLATITGYDCTGTRTRDGKTYNFRLKVTRNTDTLYPGTLARKAHNAFLSIASETGFPLDGPITWSWRELCRRMQISNGGTILKKLTEAIEATASLRIKSHEALLSHDGKAISTGTNEITHLYNRVTFINGRLPDASKADTNYLWLSDWFLENLNHNYFAYLDYDLWLHLDNKSSIASRLYELSLTKFYKNAVLQINYPTLAQLLPVKVHDRYSAARRQLDPHFKIVTAAGVLTQPRWHRRNDSKIAKLHLYPGQRLIDFKHSPNQALGLIADETVDDITVKELHTKPQPPEAKLVSDFYKSWQETQQQGNATTLVELRTATPKELAQVRRYVAAHGLRKTKTLINDTIDILATEWPKAKTFAAVDKYIDQAVQQLAARESTKKTAARKQEHDREEQDRHARQQQHADYLKAEWKPVWDSLSDDEREEIKTQLLKTNFPAITDHRQQRQVLNSHFFLMTCLEHLEQQHTAELATA